MDKKMTKNSTEPHNKKVAVIWARVNPNGDAERLRQQVIACKKYAKENDIEVDYTYAMMCKGVSQNNKFFTSLVQFLAQHPYVNTILVESYDRLTRANIDFVNAKCFLQSKGVNIVSITQPFGRKSFTDVFGEVIIEGYSQYENRFCRFFEQGPSREIA